MTTRNKRRRESSKKWTGAEEPAQSAAGRPEEVGPPPSVTLPYVITYTTRSCCVHTRVCVCWSRQEGRVDHCWGGQHRAEGLLRASAAGEDCGIIRV